MTEAARPVVAAHVSSRGPRFYRGEDGAIMFKITLDARSSIGPRPMIDADKHQYPTAWKAFEDEEAAEQLAAEERECIRAEGECQALERIGKPIDVHGAKAAADADKAERQAAMDRKRGGGL